MGDSMILISFCWSGGIRKNGNLRVTSSRPGDACVCRWTGPLLVQVISCHLFVANPLLSQSRFSIGQFWTDFNEISIKQSFLKMSSAKCRPCCSGFAVLNASDSCLIEAVDSYASHVAEGPDWTSAVPHVPWINARLPCQRRLGVLMCHQPVFKHRRKGIDEFCEGNIVHQGRGSVWWICQAFPSIGQGTLGTNIWSFSNKINNI